MKSTQSFEDETWLLKLHNITGHVGQCKEKQKYDAKKQAKAAVNPDPDVPLTEQMNLRESSKMMADWLKGGELNPEVDVTQKGFLRMFSAWILDESLPWTTGEAPTLRMLFEYLGCQYQLPSDMTVRNQLAKIFIELHGKVVREFAVRLPPSIYSLFPKHGLGGEVEDCIFHGYLDDLPNGPFIRLCVGQLHRQRLEHY